MTTTTTPGPTQTNPWDRRPNETSKAYEGFTTYRDQGKTRSTAAVATALGKSKTLMHRWSSTHAWVERAQAWDDQAAGIQTTTMLDELQRRARRQAEIATLHGEALALPARELLQRLQADPGLLRTLPLGELIRLEARAASAYRLVMQAERLARGMTTENLGGHDGGDLLGGRPAQDLSDDELERTLMGEAGDQVAAYLQGVQDGKKASS